MALIRPRLLPLTIVVLALLLAQKTALLVDAAMAGTDGAADGMAAPVNQAVNQAMPVTNWLSNGTAPALCPPPDASVDTSEVSVLSALRKRSAALDARETALDRKQALIDASEQQLSSQLAGLQAVEDRLTALSQTQNQAEEARWQALVSTYEAMDPQAAASIFNGLDDNVLLPVLQRMNSRKSAVVLADMDPDKARQATELMAGQGQDINLGNTDPAPSLP